MPERKKTPDVMADLLGDRSSKHVLGPQEPSESDEVAAPPDPPADSPSAEEPRTQPSATPDPPEPERQKATYYIDTHALDRLEMAWFRLRQQVPADDRRHVSKSLIVETALTLALDELEESATTSPLARIILNP